MTDNRSQFCRSKLLSMAAGISNRGSAAARQRASGGLRTECRERAWPTGSLQHHRHAAPQKLNLLELIVCHLEGYRQAAHFEAYYRLLQKCPKRN